MEHWLKTDETRQAVLALDLVNEHLARVIDDTHHWQWVIVGLHIALQGFMVLALHGTNDLNVLTEEGAKEWMAAYERKDGKYPKPKLDGFLALYGKIKSNRMTMYDKSRSFRPTGTQGNSVRRLNSLRNEFIHFVPKGWSLEISGLPRITDDCLDVISFLAFECGNVIWYEARWEAQTKDLIESAKRLVGLAKMKYNDR